MFLLKHISKRERCDSILCKPQRFLLTLRQDEFFDVM